MVHCVHAELPCAHKHASATSSALLSIKSAEGVSVRAAFTASSLQIHSTACSLYDELIKAPLDMQASELPWLS